MKYVHLSVAFALILSACVPSESSLEEESESALVGVISYGNCTSAEQAKLAAAVAILVEITGTQYSGPGPEYARYESCLASASFVENGNWSGVQIATQLRMNTVTGIWCSNLGSGTVAQAWQQQFNNEEVYFDKSSIATLRVSVIAGVIAHELMHNRGFTHSYNDVGTTYNLLTVPEQVEACIKNGVPNSVPASPPTAGNMIASDRDTTLAMKAQGATVHGAPLRLVANCSSNNPECTWRYHDGMITSDADPGLAVNAYNGAQHLTQLRLVNSCTQQNPDCTWTYHKGMFLSDRNPSLAINAFNGAQHGTMLLLHNSCDENNPDCTWTQADTLLRSDNMNLAMAAFNGAHHLAALILANNCGPTTTACRWTIRKGMIINTITPSLAMNAFNGARNGASLLLNNTCDPTNPDCTWTNHLGMWLSDRDPGFDGSHNLAMNAFNGAANGTELKLVSNCSTANADCTFSEGR